MPLPAKNPHGLTIALNAVRLAGRGVLDSIHATLPQGQLVGLIGANGAGKSTLLRACLNLVPYDGMIMLAGDECAALAPSARARRAAYLPQTRQAFWPIEAPALVALGLPPQQQNQPSAKAAIAEAMHLAGAEDLAGRRVDELSGGEATRLHLARALAGQTPILLADEPIASLDPWHQLALMEKLRRLAEEEGKLVLAALHDLTLAARFCHRVLLLHQGRLAADDVPARALDPKKLAQIWGMEIWSGEAHGTPFLLPGRLTAQR